MPRVALKGSMVTDARTLAMLTEAQRIAGFTFDYAQGSYNPNGVGASGSTHAGGGAVDVRTVPMKNKAQKMAALRALRTVGFAAWYRKPIAGLWGEHIHAIAIGGPDLSSGAQWQVGEYRAGRNGLSNRNPDPQARLGIKPTTWEDYKKPTAPPKPTKGRTKVTHPSGAWSRKAPDPRARGVKHRAQGQSFQYVAVRKVDGITWLRTVAGNWVRASRTSRGA